MFSVFDNCRSHGARVSFFTVFKEDSLHMFFWISIHKRLRRKIVVPVHSHIKLCISHIRESSFRGIELMRRNAEIHQQSVKHYSVFPQIFGQPCEVRVQEGQTAFQPREFFSARSDSLCISINAYQPSFIGQAFSDGSGMISSARGTVRINSVRLDSETVDSLIE